MKENTIEQQLKRFSKFSLSEKVESVYSWLDHDDVIDATTGPNGAKNLIKEGIECLIHNENIPERKKHSGLYDLMSEFLDPSGVSFSELIAYMWYRLDLKDPSPQMDVEEIYEKNALEAAYAWGSLSMFA